LLARDYMRSRRQLHVESGGLRETNGKDVFVPWPEVERIVVREPLSIGYGSVVVESASDRITIPRSIRSCGLILHTIRKKAPIAES